MKQNKLPLIIITIAIIFIFKNNYIIQTSILEACNLFIKKIFPSLFPMMIITDLLIFFGNIKNVKNFVFLTSIFSGSPSNAYMIKNLYLKNYLTNEEASKVLSYSFFSSPLFLYSMLSLIFPLKTAMKILIIPYIVNTTIKIRDKEKVIISNPNNKKELGNYLTTSIKNIMNTLLMVLGSITFFYLVNALFNPFKIPFITGILEISQGLNSLINLNAPTKIKEIFAITFISFGGLSIHLQIKGVLSETKISYLKFLKARIIQTIISIIIVLIV